MSIWQAILWLVNAVSTAFMAVYNVIYTVVKTIYGVFKGLVLGIHMAFAGLAKGVLAFLQLIAKGIDWLFGSNLAGTIQGWMDGIDNKTNELALSLDPTVEFEDIGDQWSDFGKEVTDMWEKNDITGNIKGVAEDGFGMIGDIWGEGLDMLVNPMDGWDGGYDFGAGIVEGLSGFDFGGGIKDFTPDDYMPQEDIFVKGGDLDSVGRIKSDVNISDEDLKLLRDITARDFLLNLQSVTPVANITFGDIKETADVDQILDVIQDMVDEQLATSLVVG